MLRSNFVQIAPEDIVCGDIIGAGHFGSVYRAKWKDRVVALKKTLCFDCEAEMLASLAHRNIIGFYGACTTAPNFFIVTEFAQNGSLFHFLEKYTLEHSRILSWASDIAAGMQYLHDGAPQRIIHRDLKSMNVLVSNDFVLKICDFGASRAVGGDTVQLGSMVGTIRWMAPEVIRQDGVINEKCDVWSFGVICWELMTSLVPYEGFEPFSVMLLVGRQSKTPPIPEHCPDLFASLLEACWAQDSANRPSFKELVDRLDVFGRDDDFPQDMTIFLGRRSIWREEVEQIMERHRTLQIEEDRLSVRAQELEQREAQVQQRELALQRQLHSQSMGLVHRPLPLVIGSDKPRHKPEDWSDKEVATWLSVLPDSLHQYASLFRRHDINGKRLLKLTDTKLRDGLGISSFGHREELLEHIANIIKSCEFPPLGVVTAMGGGDIDDNRVGVIIVARYMHPQDVDFTLVSSDRPTTTTIRKQGFPFTTSGTCTGVNAGVTDISAAVTYTSLFRRKTTKINLRLRCHPGVEEQKLTVQLVPKRSSLTEALQSVGHVGGILSPVGRGTMPFK